MKEAKPQVEHEWLHKLLGDWTFEGRMDMGPGNPPKQATGTERFTSLGDFWVRSEGFGPPPEGAPSTWSLTLGYDPKREKFIGTWIGSMMPNMYVYEGVRDGGGRVLTLDAAGPSMTDENKTARYQDIIEFVDDDHWVMRSQVLGEDGAWSQFMETHYRRATSSR
ncbi:DUF1579 domain-containing protein [Nocardia uniformis]|uniref:DUF1579 domain-containing protein n=1 Tax=Nocardia uniformis TaxID=53432 RepID=A0A849C1J1_9NOCA|nr:DUF1579 domain-containing protein [Nocardia uniformis]NNH71356.1 DUF1579 domain-containing protein [Nocardia uniformis]